MKMNKLNSLCHSHCVWRGALAILASTVLLVGTALAEDKPLVVAPEAATAKATKRVSPHVLAAQRRAQQEDELLSPRVGLQSQMHKDAVRRHIASTRLGT
jgi:hypothetical protein